MQRVNFKLPDNVYHTMTFQAKALGINNTTYIKSLILDTKIVSADTHKDYTRILGLLGNLTGNINQIAATLNVAHNEDALNTIDYEMLINMLTMILKNAEVCTGD